MLPHKRYKDGLKRGYYTYKLHAYRAIKKHTLNVLKSVKYTKINHIKFVKSHYEPVLKKLSFYWTTERAYTRHLSYLFTTR